MRNGTVLDLDDCTEFRRALRAGPPWIVHGTFILLGLFLGLTLLWLAVTKADLVVIAEGRVRPVTTPMKLFRAAGEEPLGVSFARVVEVRFHEGEEVRKGSVLIRLDTDRADREIEQRKRAIQAGDEELESLSRLDQQYAEQLKVAMARAEAELAEAREAIRRTKDQRESDIRLAAVQLEAVRDDHIRSEKLFREGLASKEELARAAAKSREAEESLKRAQVPAIEGSVEVSVRHLAEVEKDFRVKQEELELRLRIRNGEAAVAKMELARLEHEREKSIIRAPIDGVVISGDVKTGDLLEPGKPFLEIAEQKGLLFEAAVPNGELAHLSLGMPVRVKLDCYDYQDYGAVEGKVCFISPDSGLVVEPEGLRKAHYMVRIALEKDLIGRGNFRGRVKLGMTGMAEISSGQETLLRLLLKRIRQTISLS